MTIAAILDAHQGDTITADSSESVATVVARLAEKRIGALPVMQDGAVVGIFSERDVIYGIAAHGQALMDMAVGEVMTSPAITITPDAPVLTALSMMSRRRIRHLPVVEGAELRGFVSIGDLVKYRIDRIESEAEAMRDYIRMV